MAAKAYLNVAMTGAWSLVPMSASTGQVAARAASGPRRQHVVDSPADVPLPHVAATAPTTRTSSPPAARASGRRPRGPTEQPIEHGALVGTLADDAWLPLFRVQIEIGVRDVQIAAEHERLRRGRRLAAHWTSSRGSPSWRRSPCRRSARRPTPPGRRHSTVNDPRLEVERRMREARRLRRDAPAHENRDARVAAVSVPAAPVVFGLEEQGRQLVGPRLVSCRQTMSGASRAIQSITWPARARMPLTFQVAIRAGEGAEGGGAEGARAPRRDECRTGLGACCLSARYFRSSSYRTTPPAVATLRDCLRPSIGRRTWTVARSQCSGAERRPPRAQTRGTPGRTGCQSKRSTAATRRFDRGDRRAARAQLVEQARGVIDRRPRQRGLGAERRLRDAAMGRRRRDAAQEESGSADSVERPEERAHVVGAADVVEQHGDGQPRHGVVGGAGGRRTVGQPSLGHTAHSRRDRQGPDWDEGRARTPGATRAYVLKR